MQRNDGFDGGVPPHDLNAEAAVLSCLLDGFRHEPGMLSSVSFLAPEHFYSESHRQVYHAIREIAPKLGEEQTPCIVLVGSWLRDHDRLRQIQGGIPYITEILESNPDVKNVVPYARVVYEKWRLREAGKITRQLCAETYQTIDDPQAWLEKAREKLASIGYSGGSSKVSRNLEGVKECIERIREAMKGGGNITGLRTGIAKLDEMTNGLHGSQFTIIAARPSLGKSAMLQQIVLHLAKQGVGAMLFTYEMSKGEVALRHISSETSIDGKKLERGNISISEWDKVIEASVPIAQLPIFMIDEPGTLLNQVESIVMAHINQPQKHPLGLIAVDYLQLMPTGLKTSREQEIGTIARTLKRLAGATKLPVLAAAQLNRKGAAGESVVRPKLEHLRESGSLEQDANNVIFLHAEDDVVRGNEPTIPVEIIVAKQRNGPLGSVNVTFERQFTRFKNLPEDEPLATYPNGNPY